MLLVLSLLSEAVLARPMYRSRSRGETSTNILTSSYQPFPGRSRRGPKPKWVNPCGIDPTFVKNHAIFSYHDVTPLSDQELIQNILLSAKNALVHSDDFKEKFVSLHTILFVIIALLSIPLEQEGMRDGSWLLKSLTQQTSASLYVHCSHSSPGH